MTPWRLVIEQKVVAAVQRNEFRIRDRMGDQMTFGEGHSPVMTCMQYQVGVWMLGKRSLISIRSTFSSAGCAPPWCRWPIALPQGLRVCTLPRAPSSGSLREFFCPCLVQLQYVTSIHIHQHTFLSLRTAERSPMAPIQGVLSTLTRGQTPAASIASR